jgi:hypothetical protein
MEACRTTSKNKIFKFKENRSELTLVNTDQVDSIHVVVDGCEITDNGMKCDYLHIAKGIEIYIELKGQDLTRAIKQIERTMAILSANVQKQPKISYIICTRSPLASTEIQTYDRMFRQKYNSKLIVKSSPFQDKY